MRRDKGFTIVELLVVIAIICLLVALMMPILLISRDNAALIGCQSNMRQLAHGFLLYANDRKGHLPMPCGRNPSTNYEGARDWGNAICGYLGGKSYKDPEFRELMYCPAKGNAYRWNGFKACSGYFNWMSEVKSNRPLRVGYSPSRSWVIADFRWVVAEWYWDTGGRDRFAHTVPWNSEYRANTAHAGAKRNVLHLDWSAQVHSIFQNRYDTWPQDYRD